MKIKRKGVYNYDLGWHQNHSAVVVAKAAEAALVRGENIEAFIRRHLSIEPMDFMLRTKVNRKTELYHGGQLIQRVNRYYISTDGDYLFKIMEPTALQRDNWNTKPHWKHVDNGKTVNRDKAPSGKYVRTPPPTPEPPMRRIGINAGHRVTVVNDIRGGLVIKNLDIAFYVAEARKLVDGLV